MPRHFFAFAALLLPLLGGAATARDVDFNRDVRPILASKCLLCHGPDDKGRKAGLRLDEHEGAIKELKSGTRAIVPGKPEMSELLVRVAAADDDGVMPPAKSGKRLTKEEIDILTRWVAQGAPYAVHWAYVKPARPALPTVSDRTWPLNPIDNFILARLDKEKLKPAGPADRYSLARRVAIDLTGLPPTPEEADRFVNDPAPDAYEKYVDRLLASPTFGERWAQSWLDLARYADSQGYANDPDRTIWRYRDWVVQALNENLPFDRFTIDQLAGDLVPNPTSDQLIATGFHRNTLTNTEGGTNPEEFRSAAVVDRVNTTTQVWMGTTFACAQCHNHKYDPFSQKEYFQLYAVLNNTEDANSGDDRPTLQVAAVGRDEEAKRLQAQLAETQKHLQAESTRIDKFFPEWEDETDRATLPKDIADILGRPADKRDGGAKQRLMAHFHSQFDQWKKLDAMARDLDGQLKKVFTSTPILREIKPRETFIQIRGNFLAKGDKVEPGLPSVFKTPAGPVNRLVLARWLVSEDNPLTARVAVNRLWEETFGIGIVETSEDFGLQGEAPSHPELLDWLATEYVRQGWDTKQMLRLMVTSAAYRQGSQVSDDLRQRDPFNRLLARGPRVRLSGEAVRDQVLAVSGLLSPRMFGPPVQPPRPNFGLSAAFGGTVDWQSDTGENHLRRALYTRIRRNAPYPSMTTFDAPERSVCTVRRLRTNTPLQALVTLNDPVFVEAAQALARRAMKEGGESTESRIAFAFRQCLVRPPSAREVDRIKELYDKARQIYSADPGKATAMATKPLGAAPPEMNIVDLAAWTVVANALLNLDETLAKR
jgi:mono/diheme cytochrome c family protein